MLFIGCDPGKSGGVAWTGTYQEDNRAIDLTGAKNMPDTCLELAELLRGLQKLAQGRVFCYVEKLQAMPRAMRGTVASFKLGVSYGGILGVLAGLEIPYDTVSPAVWQKRLGCLSGGDKKITKAKAQAMFPQQKPTHKTADALLLAEYCRIARVCRLQEQSA
jgi:hypothetical protein